MFSANKNQSTGYIVVVFNGEIFQVSKEHPNYSKLNQEFKTLVNSDEVVDADMNRFRLLYSQSDLSSAGVLPTEDLKVVDGEVYFQGEVVEHAYCKRIVQAQLDDLTIEPMLKFLQNTLDNPSSNSKAELPEFVDHEHLPITEDGCFLAYKAVSGDYWSKRGGKLKLLKGKVNSEGKIYNGIGETIECKRSDVDDVRDHHCSHGLHVGAIEYCGPGGFYNSHGDKVVIVKVNPKDVVSVPPDHRAQKVRVCKYEVVEEYTAPKPSLYEGVIEADNEFTVDDIQALDELEFEYTNVHGDVSIRHVSVEDVGVDSIYCLLLETDPSYEEGEEYRRFKLDRIEHLELLD